MDDADRCRSAARGSSGSVRQALRTIDRRAVRPGSTDAGSDGVGAPKFRRPIASWRDGHEDAFTLIGFIEGARCLLRSSIRAICRRAVASRAATSPIAGSSGTYRARGHRVRRNLLCRCRILIPKRIALDAFLAVDPGSTRRIAHSPNLHLRTCDRHVEHDSRIVIFDANGHRFDQIDEARVDDTDRVKTRIVQSWRLALQHARRLPRCRHRSIVRGEVIFATR